MGAGKPNANADNMSDEDKRIKRINCAQRNPLFRKRSESLSAVAVENVDNNMKNNS